MFTFFVVLHVLICIALVLVVLLQAGRGGGLAGAFGGGGAAQTFFGGRGAATFLGKATAYLAVAFMAMSILLAVMSSRTGASGEGLLQERARARAGRGQLPPSTATLNPADLDTGSVFLEDAPGLGPASGDTTGGTAPAGADTSSGG